MSDAYTCLASLRTMLIAQREELKEKLATGSVHTVDASREQTVGQCKALKWTLAKINEQIRSLNSGDEPKAV